MQRTYTSNYTAKNSLKSAQSSNRRTTSSSFSVNELSERARLDPTKNVNIERYLKKVKVTKKSESSDKVSEYKSVLKAGFNSKKESSTSI